MSRFDYVAYSPHSLEIQNEAKKVAETMETLINTSLNDGRSKAMALTKLEECYTWLCKAIRDQQINDRKGL